jgi:glutamyl-tRNA(Gln) amidotransferase subunit E
VEIKGVHHHRHLPLLVHTEAFRQLNLLRVRERLAARGVEEGALPDPPDGLPWDTSELVLECDALLAGSAYPPLRQAIVRGDAVCAVRLPGFEGVLNHPTQPGITFSQEISERVRVIACPSHDTFLTHSGIRGEGIERAHWKRLARALGAGTEDAIVVTWAPEEDAATAAREIILRAREALMGVPAETRQARSDGTTGFERVLPGPDRMYPDTDTPPLPIPDSTVAQVRAQLGETPWAREARYRELGLDPRTARVLSTAPWADLFDQVDPAQGEVARRLATVLEKRLPFHIRRKHGTKPRSADGLPDPILIAPLVRALEVEDLRPEALVWAVDQVLGPRAIPPEEALADFRTRSGDEEAMGDVAERVAAQTKALEGRSRDTRIRWAMGEVMRVFRGRVDPSEVRRRLQTSLDARLGAQEGGLDE